MKAKRWNYKLLLKLLLPLTAIMIFAVYRLAISKSLEQYQLCHELRTEDGQNAAVSVSPAYTRERTALISKMYDRFLIDTLSWKNQLWNQCATYSAKYNCTLQDFPGAKQMDYEDLVLFTQTIVFSGSFQQLLRLQQHMDTLSQTGRITEVSYKMEKQTRQITLTMKLAGLSGRKYK